MLLWVGRTLIALMTLIKSTPFRSAKRLHSSRKARIVALELVLNNLRRLRLDRSIEYCQRKLLCVQNFVQELDNSPSGFFIHSAAYSPEITDA